MNQTFMDHLLTSRAAWAFSACHSLVLRSSQMQSRAPRTAKEERYSNSQNWKRLSWSTSSPLLTVYAFPLQRKIGSLSSSCYHSTFYLNVAISLLGKGFGFCFYFKLKFAPLEPLDPGPLLRYYSLSLILLPQESSSSIQRHLSWLPYKF